MRRLRNAPQTPPVPPTHSSSTSTPKTHVEDPERYPLSRTRGALVGAGSIRLGRDHSVGVRRVDGEGARLLAAPQVRRKPRAGGRADGRRTCGWTDDRALMKDYVPRLGQDESQDFFPAVAGRWSHGELPRSATRFGAPMAAQPGQSQQEPARGDSALGPGGASQYSTGTDSYAHVGRGVRRRPGRLEARQNYHQQAPVPWDGANAPGSRRP